MTTFTAINLLAGVVVLFTAALTSVAFKVRRMDEELAQARLEIITLNASVSVLNSKLALVSARLGSKDQQGLYTIWKMT